MNVIIVTPPLVQLNTPYPSGAYLSGFFKDNYSADGSQVKWFDLNIELFHSIFCKEGLTRLFVLTEKKVLWLVDEAEKKGDSRTAFNLRRYISSKDAWCEWIDFIVEILCDGSKAFSGREKAHQFLFSPFVPRGNRMEGFLEGLGREPTVDDVRFLCSYALADLADYITFAFDKDFSLIRYAEEVTAVENLDFLEVEKHLDSPVLKHFYEPVLEKCFNKDDVKPLCSNVADSSDGEQTLFCVSVPFAGTFVPALYTARFIKQKFGANAIVSLGGGFVNTDLRDFSDPRFAAYADMLSFDRGYGSYIGLFKMMTAESGWKPLADVVKDCGELYKLRIFADNGDNPVSKVLWHDQELENQENLITAEVVPDYSDIDFSRYPRVCDEKNPMHRLWTDGTWLKAYLAHGCYWHKCAFCDTKLDYVCGYRPVNVEKLFNGLLATAGQKGIYGIHFVDEALPAACLKKFALLNAQNGKKLYFWGNIRFEKVFSKDFAAFLSYCGFGAVSAGIEVATGTGLQNIKKGTDLDSIVSACAAFKEAGILVHAYMIYGFWYDTAQTVIDSMETLRQFFEAGLLDSAFWHKFSLTKNSELYEKLKTSWKGGAEFTKYGRPLETALDSWMHGKKLEQKVQKWFDFPVPAPTVKKDFVDKAIERYEQVSSSKTKGEPYWLGSTPILTANNGDNPKNNGDNPELHWFYLQEEYSVRARELFGGKDDDTPSSFIELLCGLRPEAPEEVRQKKILQITKSAGLQKALEKLHNKGLVFIP